MAHFPHTLEEVSHHVGEFRAGNTDLQERRRHGNAQRNIVDVTRLVGLDSITWDAQGAARIGALTRIATLANDLRIRQAYPALAQAAGALATPQIRAMATVGGNLLQRTRCWYYRQPTTSCYKKGGDGCLARHGNHFYGVCFDLGPCVAPHPSTLGMALLAYEARVLLRQAQAAHATPHAGLTMVDVYGNGSDARRDHQLAAGDLLTHVVLPPPVANERGAYFRAISRARAEWPLVECVVRLVVDEQNIIRFARVAIGAVANIPLRLPQVEAILVEQLADANTFKRAATVATHDAKPLPMTGYKVELVRATLWETLERAVPRE
jgi:xanthine dehydrogenase YagS FAD-binding subunit